MLKRKPKAYQDRLRRMSQSELAMQGDSCLFVIGRAINHLGPDELRDAQQALIVLTGVVDTLLEGSAVRSPLRP